ncbi:hypothetical protein QRX25_13620 [Bacillus sp. L381]|uniref:hypothetical protein n=1 Tax=Bacillus TaxID=1386 RepID=UPI0008256A32|nr:MULTISPECIES: hypothetical protein [Bacillus]QYM81626.1 hypothetical protein KTJ85_13300 [Bacillus sp. 7D3]QZY10774.1 hypothetical protein K7B13_13540 [Bacillus amyloliquefaciens]WIX20671.1 hypothetical protein QRX25_13620 [Bacillus sp. L381]
MKWQRVGKNNALLFNIRTAGIFLRAGLKKISAESLFLLKTLTDKAEQRFLRSGIRPFPPVLQQKMSNGG